MSSRPTDPEARAREIGLRMLDRQPRTRAELSRAMARKEVPDEVIEAVLDRFTEVGLVDDTAFATAWVDSRHRGRGLARRALADELRRRGVDSETVADAVTAVSNDDELVAATALARRRLRSLRGVAPAVAERRLVGMLGRKGFNGAVAHQVVRAAMDDTDDDAYRDDQGAG